MKLNLKKLNNILANCIILLLLIGILASCSSILSVRSNNMRLKKANYREENLLSKNVKHEKEVKIDKLPDFQSQAQTSENPATNNIPNAISGEPNGYMNDEHWVLLDSKIDDLSSQIQFLESYIKDLNQKIATLESKLSSYEDSKANVQYKNGNVKKAAKAEINSTQKTIKRNERNYNIQPKSHKIHNDIQTNNASKNADAEKELLMEKKLKDAVEFIKTKRYNDAMNLLDEIEQVKPQSEILHEVYFWKGEINFRLKKWDESAKYLSKTIETDGKKFKDRAMIMLGECYARQGKIQEAKAMYKKFLEAFPFSEFAPRAKKMIQQL